MGGLAGDGDVLIPPENFALVEPGIYRSGFPGKKHFPFLRRLALRSVLYLCPEEYPDANLLFLTQQRVQLLQYGVGGNKEPDVEIPASTLSLALLALLDRRNHPILIHCNKGKHRTGCMVGVLRRALGWSLASIFDEYRRFSAPKERFMDQQCIELWQMSLPTDHPIALWKQRRDERRRLRAMAVQQAQEGEQPQQQQPVAALEDEGDENDAEADQLALLLDYSPYLLNPEANEPLGRATRDKDGAVPSTRSHALSAAAPPPAALLHASSDRNNAAAHATPALRPLSAQHHHTHSHPNLSSLLKGL